MCFFFGVFSLRLCARVVGSSRSTKVCGVITIILLFTYVCCHRLRAQTGVVGLEASAAFEGLSTKEKLYALHLGKADWEGAKICLLQCAPECAPIFSLLQLAFAAQPVSDLLAASKVAGLTDEEISMAMMYSAAFYGNMGNYK